MRVCSKCQQALPVEAYYSKGKENRLNSYCKKCFNRYCQRRWIDRKILAIEYMGNACADCGQTFAYPVYEFHHKNPTDKDMDWNKMRLRSKSKLFQELDKCVLLCANCHRMRHHRDELAKLDS